MAERRTRILCCAQSQLQHYTKTLAFVWLMSHLAFKNTTLVPKKSACFSQRTGCDPDSKHTNSRCVCSRSKRRPCKSGENGSIKASPSYKVTLDPLAQAFDGRVGDLAAETLPFLRVHHLKNTPQLFQKVKRSQATHERRGGGLAIKHAVRVVQSLGACWTAERNQDLQGVFRYIYYSFWFTIIASNQF